MARVTSAWWLSTSQWPASGKPVVFGGLVEEQGAQDRGGRGPLGLPHPVVALAQVVEEAGDVVGHRSGDHREPRAAEGHVPLGEKPVDEPPRAVRGGDGAEGLAFPGDPEPHEHHEGGQAQAHPESPSARARGGQEGAHRDAENGEGEEAGLEARRPEQRPRAERGTSTNQRPRRSVRPGPSRSLSPTKGRRAAPPRDFRLDPARPRYHPRTMTRAAFAVLLTLAACGGEEQPAAATTPADGTYTVRGQVGDVGEESLVIHHEAIPEFVNREGEPSGMASMSMAFHRPDSVSIEGIESGDKVELTFEVRWQGEHTLALSAIEELPEDTVLDLSADHH